jgi:hypothetical protein
MSDSEATSLVTEAVLDTRLSASSLGRLIIKNVDDIPGNTNKRNLTLSYPLRRNTTLLFRNVTQIPQNDSPFATSKSFALFIFHRLIRGDAVDWFASGCYCSTQCVVRILLQYAMCSQDTTAVCNVLSGYYCSTQCVVRIPLQYTICRHNSNTPQNFTYNGL